MDRVRVEDQLKKNGFQIEQIGGLETCLRFLQTNSGMVIIDLQNTSLAVDKMQHQMATRRELAKRILSYFPHVQIHLKKGVEQCGIKHVYPRSVFFNDVAALIQKVNEEES